MFHTSCFSCSCCAKPFASGVGMARSIEAAIPFKDAYWCVECFEKTKSTGKCIVCSKTAHKKVGANPYCNKHFATDFNASCFVCAQQIDKDSFPLSPEDPNVCHPACYVCSTCQQPSQELEEFNSHLFVPCISRPNKPSAPNAPAARDSSCPRSNDWKLWAPCSIWSVLHALIASKLFHPRSLSWSSRASRGAGATTTSSVATCLRAMCVPSRWNMARLLTRRFSIQGLNVFGVFIVEWSWRASLWRLIRGGTCCVLRVINCNSIFMY